MHGPDLLASLPWLVPYASIFLLAWRRPRLTDVPPVTGRLISIVVPARNEAGNIATLLASLRSSNYAPIEILVVDDRSTDDTAAIVAGIAREDSRVRLIPGEDLPQGWYGKPWACLQGYRAAAGEVILFTDADTRHLPALLGHAAGALESADLLTVVTGQDCVGFWERVVMPQFWVPLGLRYHPMLVNRARKARDVIANGQFVMVTRREYEAAGTHAAVRGAVAEDLALAQAFHRRGLRVRMWWADDLIRTRMYTGLAHLVEGWSKNLYLGGRASFPEEPLLRFLAPALLSLGFLFWLAPVMALALTAGATWAWWSAGFAAGFWTLIAYGMRIPLWYGLSWPLGAAVALGIVVRSTLRGARRVEWRGRVYADPTSG
jgi:chlorobactene glucosyltransferase